MQTNDTRGPRADCNLSRRDCLRIGSLSAGGLSLANLMSARAIAQDEAARGAGVSQSAASFGRAKSVILFWLMGGPAQHET